MQEGNGTALALQQYLGYQTAKQAVVYRRSRLYRKEEAYVLSLVTAFLSSRVLSQGKYPSRNFQTSFLNMWHRPCSITQTFDLVGRFSIPSPVMKHNLQPWNQCIWQSLRSVLHVTSSNVEGSGAKQLWVV